MFTFTFTQRQKISCQTGNYSLAVRDIKTRNVAYFNSDRIVAIALALWAM